MTASAEHSYYFLLFVLNLMVRNMQDQHNGKKTLSLDFIFQAHFYI